MAKFPVFQLTFWLDFNFSHPTKGGIFRCIKKPSQSVWTNFQTPELRVVVMSKLDKRLDRFWERRNKASYWLDLAKKTLGD